MTDKARELLERALEQADYIYFVTCEADTLAEEIRAYLAEPEVKEDDEPVATLDHNGNFKLLRMVGVTFEQPINLYTYPASRKPFVRLTDEELIKLGSEHVGPMSDGEFHLMVITQNALEEKNK